VHILLVIGTQLVSDSWRLSMQTTFSLGIYPQYGLYTGPSFCQNFYSITIYMMTHDS